MLKTVHTQPFQIGDIVVETYQTEVITTFIICDMEDKGKDTVYNMYILWSSSHWDESQGSMVIINRSHIESYSEGPYVWKKL
tara:strand:+ start:1444 stop:1689 length:246 start_codon:yes stop_codon:yes gene_type:complete